MINQSLFNILASLWVFYYFSFLGQVQEVESAARQEL